PCGYHGSTKKACLCSPHGMELYYKKLSGPILDRIDMHVRVKEVDLKKMTQQQSSGESSTVIRQRVLAAHHIQLQRYRTTPYTRNADINSKDVKKLFKISPSAQLLLAKGAARHRLSARGYFKVIKVAQTIADLDHQNIIAPHHLAEALQYRHY
ncbi:MAG TPA: ATP-binding protein, partial [Patescibacteria group bacterium]